MPKFVNYVLMLTQRETKSCGQKQGYRPGVLNVALSYLTNEKPNRSWDRQKWKIAHSPQKLRQRELKNHWICLQVRTLCGSMGARTRLPSVRILELFLSNSF